MIALSCSNISLSFGTDKLLENISFHAEKNDRIGIVGVNGAGKSTLFKIISGAMQPDSGEVYIAKGYKLGFLEQNSGLDSSKTIWDELIATYSHLIDMEKRLKILEADISTEKDQNRLNSLMKEYSLLSDKFSHQGGYEYNSRVRGVLRGLGFSDNEFDRCIETLSGGQKTRMALAKLLLEEPDILLLDEPTNHLDIEALEWLEDFLKGYTKCVILISHDRYFLDSVTTKTIELENCECTLYNGNYSYYVKQKEINREIHRKHYEQQQKEIARMEAFIEQQRRWNREKNIVAAESRQKAIDRMEKISKPKELPKKINIKFRGGVSSGNDVLFVENLSKSYPGKELFNSISFKLRKAENVFLLGPNGCGKSTLLKILSGRLEKNSGVFEYGTNVRLGYYDQEQEELDESCTILEEICNSNEKLTITDIRTALASFLFMGEEVLKPISILSGGEKSRVALVKLMLSGSNFLILDEPTNHLDINSREVLEDSLRNFEGTILAVSHDRYFINKLASRIIELDGNSLIDFSGGYSGYLEQRSRLKKNTQDQAEEVKFSVSKMERLTSKEEKARQRRILKQLSDTEQEINRIEQRLASIETEMNTDIIISDHVKLTELHTEQSKLEARLQELYETWEVLASENQETTV